MIGENVSHYRIVDELGSGAMGVVYRAEDTRLGREVALKFLPPELTRDAEARERFKLEAQAASGLDHANICTIHDVDETDDGRMFIAMTLYGGETLKERLTRGPLSVEDSIDIAAQVAAGLERAHSQGIVHRDIKPANLMITEHGEVKILDFGVAKLAGEAGLTRTGTTVGTPSYMAPEQVEGGEIVPATDLWAVGALLYQMLTGRPPFARPSDRATLAAILAVDPQPLAEAREEVPEELAALASELLSKDPGERPASAGDVANRLRGLQTAAVVDAKVAEATGSWSAGGSGAAKVWKRPGVIIAAIAVLGITGITIAAFLGARSTLGGGGDPVADARASLPRIEELATAGRYAEAYDLAVVARQALGSDSTLQTLLVAVIDTLTITSSPPGADVYALRFEPGQDTITSQDQTFIVSRDATGEPMTASTTSISTSDMEHLGQTPIEGVEVARGDYYVRVEMNGRLGQERIASSAYDRRWGRLRSAAVVIDVDLPVEGEWPEEMVAVPGDSYTLVSPGLPTGLVAQLDDFFIDRFEVSNADYRAFIRDGGYERPELWSLAFADGGEQPSRGDALGRLTDRTGLPGPRSWSNQEYPPGRDRHPVTDVSWYEAAAYCAYAGKRLPTTFEWEKTARDGRAGVNQFIMPWGYVIAGSSTEGRANFASDGTRPVDGFPFGISPYGAHAMAGNVKEWIFNRAGDDRFYTGGSWEDPMYVFSNFGYTSPYFTTAGLGFRCAVTAPEYASGRITLTEGSVAGAPLDLDRVTPTYEPVDEAGFRAILTHYRYDKRPIEGEVVASIETPDWIRETIHYPAPAGGDVIAYLYLPKRVEPPYQTLVYVPGASAWYVRPLDVDAERRMAPHIKAGRALFTVVMNGMVGRDRGPDHTEPPTESVQFRDEMVEQAIELRMGIDYLETREDIDMNKLAYGAISRGAASRLAFAGVDDRYKTAVLIGGGIDERFRPTLPEADPTNFAPYLGVPVLLINGREDEEHPWLTRGLPLWNLLSEPKELELVEGSGHQPDLEVRVPRVNAWLDRHLGPVR